VEGWKRGGKERTGKGEGRDGEGKGDDTKEVRIKGRKEKEVNGWEMEKDGNGGEGDRRKGKEGYMDEYNLIKQIMKK